MIWKKIEFSDIEVISKYLTDELLVCDFNEVAAELSPLTLCLWSNYGNTHFAIAHDCLCIRHDYSGRMIYRYPFGKGDKIQAAKEAFGEENFQVISVSEFGDYLYIADKLRTLSGKKLHSKKNHFNAFVRENPEYVIEEMNEDSALQCAEKFKEWVSQHKLVDNKSFAYGGEQLIKLLSNFNDYKNMFSNLKGSLIRKGEELDVLAFTISEALREDTVLIHYEHAAPDVRGAYAAINKLNLEKFYPDVTYVNREDAAGEEGLKKAKESYNPICIVDKRIIIAK